VVDADFLRAGERETKVAVSSSAANRESAPAANINPE
jgi:hypothetical protein